MVPLAFMFSGAIAVLAHLLVYSPIIRRGGKRWFMMVASIGVAFIIRYSVYIMAGIEKILNVQATVNVSTIYQIGGIGLTNVWIWSVTLAACLVISLQIILSKTGVGTAMRAVAGNAELARARGINSDLIVLVTWFVAGGLAGTAGFVWAASSSVTPEIGWLLLFRAYAASILGGMVSFYGTVAGGFILGIAENLGMDLLHESLGVNVAFKPIISFAIMVAVLLIKPTGLSDLKAVKTTSFLRRFTRSSDQREGKLRVP